MTAEDAAARGKAARDSDSLDVLETALRGDWLFVSIDQYGPDQTTVIGRIVFLVCPVCGAMVPQQSAETETFDFQGWHREWHLRALSVDLPYS